ncbi:ATP-grasp domain-containing protein [Salinarimonas rosea]|uniref:ATP-grasp domain-containing protein n=1 Tax=Salinarimonas rosea TaxID=552063 RepID=UPI0003F59F7C|nr:ATP-grasp domain-containing protein [Salinarimonas rosea]
MAHLLIVDANLPGLQALARAKALGHRVTFVRGTSYAMYPRTPQNEAIIASADRLVDVPATSDTPALLALGRALADEGPIDGILTQQEYAVEATAALAEALGLPFLSLASARLARRKAQARARVEDAGLASAAHAVVPDADAAGAAAREIGFPVIVKPPSGCDSILAARCDDEAAVRRAAQAILAAPQTLPEQLREQFSRGILVEERLEGPLVSAEIAFFEGRPIRYMLSGRVRGRADETVEVGAAMPAAEAEGREEACFAYAEAVAEALGFDFGFVHIEMILTARGPVLVEANPRLMGGIMPRLYEEVSGRTILDDVVALHLGAAPRPPTGIAQAGTTRKIMPRADGRLAQALDAATLEAVRADLALVDAPGLVDGAAVRRDEILGRLIATAPTMAEADARADAALGRIADAIGVELVR